MKRIVLITTVVLTAGLMGCEPALMEGDVRPVVYNTPAQELFEPKVSIRCSRGPEGELVVDVAPNSRVRLISHVWVTVEGDELERWHIHCERLGVALLGYIRYGQIRHVVYGEIPNDTIQEYPEGDVPPAPLPPEAVVHVMVKYEAVGTLALGDGWSGWCCIWVELVGDDEVKYLGESRYCRHFQGGENRFFISDKEQAGGE